MLTTEFIADKTIVQTAPLLFTGIVDEAISADFTLYLLQEAEEKFVVFAPSYYNADKQSAGTLLNPQVAHALAENVYAEFTTLEDAKAFFVGITEHLGTPLDLHDLAGGFLLLPFDITGDVYVNESDVKAKVLSYLISHGQQHIIFRAVLLEDSIIINKRMVLKYESKDAAFATYIKIARYFKEKEQLNLSPSVQMIDIHSMFDAFLQEQFAFVRQITTVKDDFGRYLEYGVHALKGNLQLVIHYALVNNLLDGSAIKWSVSLYDATTKIFYVREISTESKRELEELVQRVVAQFSEAGV